MVQLVITKTIHEHQHIRGRLPYGIGHVIVEAWRRGIPNEPAFQFGDEIDQAASGVVGRVHAGEGSRVLRRISPAVPGCRTELEQAHECI